MSTEMVVYQKPTKRTLTPIEMRLREEKKARERKYKEAAILHKIKTGEIVLKEKPEKKKEPTRVKKDAAYWQGQEIIRIKEQIEKSKRKLSTLLVENPLIGLKINRLTLEIENYLKVLAEAEKPKRFKRTPESIVAVTARKFGLAEEEIVSRRRTRHLIKPRQFLFYHCYMRLKNDFSLPVIGRKLGFHHTTIIHGAQRYAEEHNLPFGVRVQARTKNGK